MFEGHECVGVRLYLQGLEQTTKKWVDNFWVFFVDKQFDFNFGRLSKCMNLCLHKPLGLCVFDQLFGPCCQAKPHTLELFICIATGSLAHRFAALVMNGVCMWLVGWQ